MYEYIQSEYNFFIHSKEKKTSKTMFMIDLANKVGTSLSNLYEIIRDGIIEILNHDFTKRIEFNANTAFNKRTKKNCKSNSLKLELALPFINLVIKEFRSDNNINSIDEIINDLIINRSDEITGMTTICTTTFYNYVEAHIIPGFSKHELPMKTKRKKKDKDEDKAKTKPKGKSIELRPFEPDDRSDFGHWEGDTVVGGMMENSGAILTLVERKTRYQITVKMKDRKADTVLKSFNKIKALYPDFNIKKIFKSITFDNGNEFAKWEEIEKKYNTEVYFAHPYSSWERGTNENGNKLLRLFLPKGCNINKYPINYVMNANELINLKIRKILGYKSALELFNEELALAS